MANQNAPFGLRPLRTLSGTNVNTSNYSIATDYTTAIYTGDVVERSGTGRNVTKAAATNVDNIGVFAGCSYTDANGKPVWSAYWPGVSDSKTNIVAYVYDDPNIVFEVQADACAVGEIGVQVDWNVGTGSTLTGISGLYAVVNGTSATTGGSLNVLKLVDRPDNAYGAYAKIEVMFAEHSLARVVSGVGGI